MGSLFFLAQLLMQKLGLPQIGFFFYSISTGRIYGGIGTKLLHHEIYQQIQTDFQLFFIIAYLWWKILLQSLHNLVVRNLFYNWGGKAYSNYAISTTHTIKNHKPALTTT
eukprot:TRINITY_DN22860_c0_g1_i3.p3 TRINITY_DN22860_c0_g1~~TRINITY_DN22860_c0_g1_i3.p3  ORF type:complete len:110 (-),score=2.37 TRINITY_DN22860_c0_g1_i3:46-375(-)